MPQFTHSRAAHGGFIERPVPLMTPGAGFAGPPTTGADAPERARPVPLMLDGFVAATATGGVPERPLSICVAAGAEPATGALLAEREELGSWPVVAAGAGAELIFAPAAGGLDIMLTTEL